MTWPLRLQKLSKWLWGESQRGREQWSGDVQPRRSPIIIFTATTAKRQRHLLTPLDVLANKICKNCTACVCMCVCVHECVHACMCIIHMNTCAHMGMCICICIYKSVAILMPNCMRTLWKLHNKQWHFITVFIMYGSERDNTIRNSIIVATPKHNFGHEFRDNILVKCS